MVTKRLTLSAKVLYCTHNEANAVNKTQIGKKELDKLLKV